MTLIPASAPDHFTEDTPTAVLVRQVLGAIAQFDKASTVAKLKAAASVRRADRAGADWRDIARVADELRDGVSAGRRCFGWSRKRDEARDKHLYDALIVSPMRSLLSGSGSSAMLLSSAPLRARPIRLRPVL